MRSLLLVFTLLFAQPIMATDVVEPLWEKSPSSNTDRFCIAVFSRCLGLIDSTGRVVVRFDPARRVLADFFDGLMPMHDPVENKEGYIDKDGQWAIPPRFYVARRFEGGYAVVSEASGGPWRLIDRSGDFVGPPANYGIRSFRRGLAPIQPSKDELAGYIDISGGWAIPQRFRRARDFSEEDGLAAVQSADGSWGYIAPDGSFKIAPTFLRATDFEFGRASVVTEGPCWFWIDRKYDLFAPPYSVTLPGGESESSRQQPEGIPECRMTLIDTEGRPASKYEFQWLENFTADGIAAKVANKWGVLGLDGEWITPPVWDAVLPFAGGLAGVHERGRGWGYVDTLGIVTIEPTYSFAQAFSEGLAAVADEQRNWFYILPDGTKAFEGVFKVAGPFRRGIAHVMVDDQTWEYIDKQGRTVFRYTRE